MLKNKLVHTLLAVVIIAAIFSSSVVTFYADVYFNVDGYTFEPVNNNYVSLVSSDLEANGTDLVVPNTAYSRFVGSVKEYAFMNSEITSVSFRQANGLSEIGRYAFYNCKNIQELYIPYRVKQIGTAAFSGCEQRTQRSESGTAAGADGRRNRQRRHRTSQEYCRSVCP